MRITLYKLTPQTKFDASAFRDSAKYDQVSINPLSGAASAALFIKPYASGEPKWAGELRSLLIDPKTMPTIQSLSNGAVLFVQQGSGKFAITFGSGFQAINPARVVPGFGLRVAANSIAQAKIKSADTRMLSSAGKSQRIILPEASELTALGIEPLEEWVRQLSGSVADQTFASTAAGSDSLRLTIKDFSLVKLPAKLAAIEKLYKATAYKTSFPFLDYFQQVDAKLNQALISKLDKDVLVRVRASASDVFFAAPEPFDIPDVHNYRLTRRKNMNVGDLAQAEVFDALSKLDLTDDGALRAVSVRALDGDGKIYGKPTTMYECIQAEVALGATTYVLSAGRWFQVSKDYIKQVDDFLTTVTDVTSQLSLPAWEHALDGSFETEGAYNMRVHKAQGYALLDKKNLHFGGHQKVEICDLMTPDRMLVCVKRATRSSTLSHLFAQGSVSASLMYHPDYQKRLVKALKEVGAKDSFGQLADWTIVYAIATEKTGPILKDMFFFSRMNLMTHIQDIRSRGIAVVIARITMP